MDNIIIYFGYVFMTIIISKFVVCLRDDYWLAIKWKSQGPFQYIRRNELGLFKKNKKFVIEIRDGKDDVITINGLTYILEQIPIGQLKFQYHDYRYWMMVQVYVLYEGQEKPKYLNLRHFIRNDLKNTLTDFWTISIGPQQSYGCRYDVENVRISLTRYGAYINEDKFYEEMKKLNGNLHPHFPGLVFYRQEDVQAALDWMESIVVMHTLIGDQI